MAENSGNFAYPGVTTFPQTAEPVSVAESIEYTFPTARPTPEVPMGEITLLLHQWRDGASAPFSTVVGPPVENH